MKIKLGQAIASLEKVSMVLSLLWLTGGIDIQFLAFIAYPTTVFFLIVRWKETLWKTIQEKFLWLFIGFLLISVVWAADFNESLYMSLKLIGTVLIGLSLGVRYSLKEQLQILAWAFGLAVILSLFYGIALPARGIMTEGSLSGNWKGIYVHKNQLGRNMVLSTMVFMLQAMSCQRYRWLTYSGVFFSFVLIILSRSSTALLVVVTLLALLPLYRALRWSYSWLIPFFSVIILSIGSLSLLIVSQLDKFFGVFGKDTTLTGRIPLWEKVLAKIWEHPWLGYGYGGFWTKPNGEAADIWITETWEPGNSHNGLLDIWLSVGIVGVLLAILAFATIFLRSLKYLRLTKSSSGIWPLWLLTLIVLINTTESTLESRSIIWAFYSAIAISTHWKTIKQYSLDRSLSKFSQFTSNS